MKESNTAEASAQFLSSLGACITFIRQCKRDCETQIAHEAKTKLKKSSLFIVKKNRKATSVLKGVKEAP